MALSTDNDGRFIWPKWHRVRQRKRETTSNPDESDDQERRKYDLDDDDPFSARIDGEETEGRFTGEDIGPRQPGTVQAVDEKTATDDPVRF